MIFFSIGFKNGVATAKAKKKTQQNPDRKNSCVPYACTPVRPRGMGEDGKRRESIVFFSVVVKIFVATCINNK